MALTDTEPFFRFKIHIQKDSHSKNQGWDETETKNSTFQKMSINRNSETPHITGSRRKNNIAEAQAYIGKQKVTPLFARITDLPSGFYCIFDGQFFGFFCSNKNFTQKKLFIAFLMDNFSVLLELFDFARSNTPPPGGAYADVCNKCWKEADS